MKPVIAFIGAGKMANALIGGLLRVGHSPKNIWASCPTKTHLEVLQTRFDISVTQDNTVAASQADILLLAVKPQHILTVLAELHSTIVTRQPVLISIAASVSEQTISSILNPNIVVVRAMPNTPAFIGHGMTALYAKQSIADIHKHQVEAIFQAVGETLWIEHEDQMNPVTALSGSGPAYFFMLMQAMEEAGVALGLTREIAHRLVLQTAIGSAHMANETTQTLQELREQVTSPGGGTAAAVEVLKSQEFLALVLEAVKAAKERYEVMGKDVLPI